MAFAQPVCMNAKVTNWSSMHPTASIAKPQTLWDLDGCHVKAEADPSTSRCKTRAAVFGVYGRIAGL